MPCDYDRMKNGLFRANPTYSTLSYWSRMNPETQAHCETIRRCNQRGGRMLSIVDLLEAGTLTRDLAAYALAAIGAGASFMVGAQPGGAGKTTVMGALLNLVPRDTKLVTAENEAVVEQGIIERSPRRCYVCHEIGAGFYHAYLWGKALRHYFKLPVAGHMLATNLHADTFEQARHQVCVENAVPEADFRHMNLLFFISVEHSGGNVRRRIVSAWESDGAADHRPVFGPDTESPLASKLVSTKDIESAVKRIDAILQSGARTIEHVREALVNATPSSSP